MLTILLVAGIISYFVAGVFTARSQYAREMRQTEAMPSFDELKSKWQKKKKQLHSIEHRAGCNLRYYGLRNQGCDCANRQDWNELRDEIESLYVQMNSVPQVKVGYIFLWWIHLTTLFIKSGYRPTEKTDEQKLNEWIGYMDPIVSQVRSDPKYDNTTFKMLEKVDKMYASDHKAGHPLATRPPRELMEDPSRIPTSRRKR